VLLYKTMLDPAHCCNKRPQRAHDIFAGGQAGMLLSKTGCMQLQGMTLRYSPLPDCLVRPRGAASA